MRSEVTVDEIECVIKHNSVHVACLTESWLTDSISTDIINIDGFNCFRRDRCDGRRGGGIVCYVVDSLQCRRLTDLECNHVESLWLLCRNHRMPRRVSHILIGVIYFPPNGDKLCTVNHIISCLDTVTQKHPYCGIMLCGDFNQLNDHPILSYPLKQIVTLATRRHNILDKVFTSIADWYHIPTILPPIGTSDHNVVLVHALASQPHSHPTGSCFVAVRSSDPSGKTLLAHALNRLNWVSLYKMNDCNDMLNHFLPRDAL